jgi:hypothetical protein
LYDAEMFFLLEVKLLPINVNFVPNTKVPGLQQIFLFWIVFSLWTIVDTVFLDDIFLQRPQFLAQIIKDAQNWTSWR